MDAKEESVKSVSAAPSRRQGQGGAIKISSERYRAFLVLDGTAQVPTQIFRQVDFEIEGLEGTNAGSELAFFHLLSTVFPSPFLQFCPSVTTTPQQTHSVRQQPIDPAQRQTFLTKSLDLSTLLLTTLYFFI
jgi:hypothetical protein